MTLDRIIIVFKDYLESNEEIKALYFNVLSRKYKKLPGRGWENFVGGSMPNGKGKNFLILGIIGICAYHGTDIIKHKLTLNNNLLIQSSQHIHEKDMQQRLFDHQDKNK